MWTLIFLSALAYPCWPDDFVWSNDGLPPNCNCGPKSINPNSNPVCRCNCIKMHTHKSDTSWSNNLLCFRDTQSNPRLVLSKKSKFLTLRHYVISISFTIHYSFVRNKNLISFSLRSQPEQKAFKPLNHIV